MSEKKDIEIPSRTLWETFKEMEATALRLAKSDALSSITSSGPRRIELEARAKQWERESLTWNTAAKVLVEFRAAAVRK